MSTTNNRPTPATATKLHAMLDDMLSPTRASTPEPPTMPPGATSLVDDMNEIARSSQPRPPRAPAARLAAPPTVLRESQSFHTELYEGYEYDPMPTSDDPWGLRERMDHLEAAIAARTAPARCAPIVPPMLPLTEARLTKAHQRLDEILG